MELINVLMIVAVILMGLLAILRFIDNRVMSKDLDRILEKLNRSQK